MNTMNQALLPLLFATALAQAEPVKLIFDTDMGNDVDDLMALCMIHNLQSRGAVELLAVTITKDHPQAAAFVDAVNTFFGRPDTPVGVVKGGATPEPGKFNLLAEAKNEDGSPRYPHDLMSGNDAPEATGLLRKLLAAQPDNRTAANIMTRSRTPHRILLFIVRFLHSFCICNFTDHQIRNIPNRHMHRRTQPNQFDLFLQGDFGDSRPDIVNHPVRQFHDRLPLFFLFG